MRYEFHFQFTVCDSEVDQIILAVDHVTVAARVINSERHEINLKITFRTHKYDGLSAR